MGVCESTNFNVLKRALQKELDDNSRLMMKIHSIKMSIQQRLDDHLKRYDITQDKDKLNAISGAIQECNEILNLFQ